MAYRIRIALSFSYDGTSIYIPCLLPGDISCVCSFIRQLGAHSTSLHDSTPLFMFEMQYSFDNDVTFYRSGYAFRESTTVVGLTRPPKRITDIVGGYIAAVVDN